MGLGLLFYICMLLFLIYDGFVGYRAYGPIGGGRTVLLFILLLCLGWHCFGAPIK